MKKNLFPVLVIGGAGYIGSHTCKLLKQLGFLPITYDNLIYGHRDFVRWGPFEYGDILDTVRLIDVLKKYQPQAVLHFAGFGYVGESNHDPLKYYWNNVGGTISLLKAMKAVSVKKIVFSSTCATYGVSKNIPIQENDFQNPVNPYGQSKLMVEKILKDAESDFGLQSIVLRYFNAAGCDLDREIGEDHDPELHLIPIILDVALGRRNVFTILGNDYETFDGTCIRDYVHVTDLALAHVKALNYLETNKISNSFNLGTGKGFSVNDIVKSVEKISGKKILRKIGPRRKGDPAILVADNFKALKELGWSLKYSDIDTIVDSAWKWHVDRFGCKKEKFFDKNIINCSHL